MAFSLDHFLTEYERTEQIALDATSTLLDEDGNRIIPLHYGTTWCEQCGSTFEWESTHKLRADFGSTPKHCSTECTKAARKSRSTDEQIHIDSYLHRTRNIRY